MIPFPLRDVKVMVGSIGVKVKVVRSPVWECERRWLGQLDLSLQSSPVSISGLGKVIMGSILHIGGSVFLAFSCGLCTNLQTQMTMGWVNNKVDVN